MNKKQTKQILLAFGRKPQRDELHHGWAEHLEQRNNERTLGTVRY